MIKKLGGVLVLTLCLIVPTITQAEPEQDPYKQQMDLFKSMETLTQIPWYYLAAINQYEKHIHKTHASDDLISITFPSPLWNGAQSIEDRPLTVSEIEVLGGIGKDGDGDDVADRTNDYDILYTMADWIKQYGTSKQDIKIAIWNYYQRDLSVQTIMNTAKVYEKFNTIDLQNRMFPVPLYHNYSYKNTWGDARGFGGRRIHEGTDIFANYGVPVRATSYGVVEMKGWNRYGGWRIGVRDINNIYHYFAHLNGFEKGVKVGQVVKPGDVIGYVGATGYGPPGTSGKFPPHLHYGMYRDNGYSEWSFDPYPYLKKWEKETRKLKK
ncbi:M23 family metallopeptidase [Pontibacillus marinus]|uniref:Peptidase M23 n=1 Tax=Pontibacillus marinus BH030004 = DSM 16465 TaxID=1385511 RepID=A0A0A5G9F7_9BACI|nr:peptidase M23 [Pontibacillus marinus BH030004 = DSM 16465]